MCAFVYIWPKHCRIHSQLRFSFSSFNYTAFSNRRLIFLHAPVTFFLLVQPPTTPPSSLINSGVSSGFMRRTLPSLLGHFPFYFRSFCRRIIVRCSSFLSSFPMLTVYARPRRNSPSLCSYIMSFPPFFFHLVDFQSFF